MISLNNLCKIYRIKNQKITALRDVNFNISKGEFIGVTGCSGNGKTTLINIIGGLLKPTSGEVYIDDINLYKMNDKNISIYRNHTVGFIFQNYNLCNGISSLENVMLPLVIGKVKRSERKKISMEALELVGLSDRFFHKPEELSGGQKQRVAIARAIVNSPKIIIADEPTGNLDEKNTKVVMEILRKINESGVTVLMVTHNEALKKYFSRQITVDKGKIIY